jgi:polar amino acid transport system substrate-binding protein
MGGGGMTRGAYGLKQLVQDNRARRLRVLDTPPPQLATGSVLVGVEYSLISSGTERAKAQLARQTLAGKALARPDLVRQVLRTARDEGVVSTYHKVQNRLAEPGLLGYSAAGRVLAVGEGVTGVRVGDEVACAGAGYANHAEVVSVPQNLVAPVPSGCTLREAAFATVGAIALHGFRMTQATLGERVGIIGLGLVGQLAAQIAQAAGCAVYGTDPVAKRVAIAGREAGLAFLEGEGRVDHVLVCASATSDEPLVRAIEACAERGRIVVIGDVPIAAAREALYRKELTLLVSRSYGPGRYDPEYEERGRDYPQAYVRWTEQRNLGAVLELIASGRLRPAPLVSQEFEIGDAQGAFEELEQGALAVLLRYGAAAAVERTPPVEVAPVPARAGLTVGLIGAGNFARDRVLPALKAHPDVSVCGITTASGVTAATAGRELGAPAFGTAGTMLAEARPAAVVITTRHDSHAALAIEAARTDAYVYVEKPLALTVEEIARLTGELSAAQQARVMVGFNRRFSPLAAAVRFASERRRGPMVLLARVNAGYLPPEHWTQGPEGGGRITGEACHFVDLIAFLAGAPVRTVAALAAPNGGRYSDDNVVVTLGLADGSIATLVYTAAGNRRMRKEYIEAHWDGHSAGIDDFRTGTLDGGALERQGPAVLAKQDKGHQRAVAGFLEAVRRGEAVPLPLESAVNTTLTTFAIEASWRTGLVYGIGERDIEPA